MVSFTLLPGSRSARSHRHLPAFLYCVFFFLLPGVVSAQTPVSQGKPTFASSVEKPFNPASATDTSSSTRWASAFSNTEWIYVDLGATYNINRVVLNWEVAYGKAYQIQVSDDASTWTTIYSTTTGDGDIDDLAIPGAGRYVRMYGTNRGTPYGYSLWDFQVYGTPAATAH